MGLYAGRIAHIDRRSRNNQTIEDVLQIRTDAVTLGLYLTTQRWRIRYDVTWIEDVVYYRIHKSLLAGSAQYEAESDGD